MISFPKSYRIIFVFIVALAGLWLLLTPSGHAASPLGYMIQLNDDTINPVTAEYIIDSIDRARTQGTQFLVLKLDTPGGLLSSTRTIVKKILDAPLPIVVYIAPSGSRAGSAGVFITYASHIAAMAPSTNIGAAHPVQLGEQKRERGDDIQELIRALRKEFKPEEESKETGTAKSKKTDDEPKTNSKETITEKKEKSPQEETQEAKEIPEPATESEQDPLSNKILQDTVAFIKSLAHERNRNADWAVKSVTESSSITETEALELKVVEIIAKDDEDLLNQLDGRVVKVKNQEVTLQTKDAFLKRVDMDVRQKFLNILANPNIAYIFMILGFYGLLYEVTHPGFGVPGVLGIIFLILAYYSLQTLPTNYAGLALIVLGIILFIAEAFVPGFGFLSFSGLVCMILGSMILFDSPDPMMRVSRSLVWGFSLATAGITIFLVQAVMRTHKRKVVSGKEGLVGEKGTAQTDLAPQKDGKVFVHGELWNAIADGDIRKGDKILVTAVEGLTVKVKKL